MKCLLLFTSLLFLIVLAIYSSNHDTVADNALEKAGYVGLNAFEYVAKELNKH